MVDTFDLADDVVVQLQNCQLGQSIKVADLYDVFELERQMREVPDRHVVLVEYLVLFVVLLEVLLYQVVIDHSWGH